MAAGHVTRLGRCPAARRCLGAARRALIQIPTMSTTPTSSEIREALRAWAVANENRHFLVSVAADALASEFPTLSRRAARESIEELCEVRDGPHGSPVMNRGRSQDTVLALEEA